MDKNLMMTICLCLGILCWAVAAYFAIRYRKDVKSVIRAVGLGVFASLFFFIYPFAVIESGIFAVPFALLQVMASAVVASDPLSIFELLSSEYSVSYLGIYQAILIVLHVVAPLFTIGITLSFFESKFASLFYRIRSSRRESHIFSDINERTLCLAESIYASNKKSIFVFIGDSEKVEEHREFAQRVHEVGGYILDMAPSEVRHSLKKTRTYYLLGTDSGRNLKDAIHLFEKYDKVGGEQIKIWLYSKDEISSVIFDNIDEKIDIRLVNEEQLISMGLMRKYPLFDAVNDGKLEFMLVGAGNIGMEILKTAIWCSQLGKNVKVRYHVLERNAKFAAEKLEKQCPGLAERYNISFESVDIETNSLTKALRGIQPDYIVVALGEEQRNLRIGAEIRRFYGMHPHIHVLTDHQDTETQILENLHISDWHFEKENGTFVKNEVCSFALLPFGSYAETYSNMRFSKGYNDFIAMSINAVRFGITETDSKRNEEYLRDLLNKVEFYKNYSYSYATSIPYKLWLMGLQLVDDGKGDIAILEETLPKFEEALVEQESARWCCYMRTQGWQPLPLDEVSGNVYQDKMRKLHARLNPDSTKKLSDILGRDFAKEDIENLYRLPAIIRLANSLTNKPYSINYIKQEETNHE